MSVLKNKSPSANPSFSPFVEENPSVNTHPYEMILKVTNKRGVLAKITLLVTQRGLGIEALNFNTAGKGQLSTLHLTLRGQRSQMQGLMNDAQKIAEIKAIQLCPT